MVLDQPLSRCTHESFRIKYREKSLRWYCELNKIKSIHYLRGVAALLVVLYHLRGALNNVYLQSNLGDLLFSYGAFGVDLFFIISGYIICYATQKREEYYVSNYIIRRFFRIYPLLLVCVSVYYIFVFDDSNLKYFIRSVIPLNYDFSAGSPFFGYNMLATAWTLTYEIAFYALFLFSMVINHKFRSAICILVILLSVFGVQYAFNGGITLQAYNKISIMDGSLLHAPLTLLSSPMFIDFIYGILIYLVTQSGFVTKIMNGSKLMFSVATIAFALSSINIISTQVYGHGPMVWGLWSAVVVISLVMMEKSKEFSEIKILSFFGDISYSLYLTHVIVIDAYHRNPEIFPMLQNVNGVTKLIFLMSIMLFIAYIAHILIEKPGITVGKNIIASLNNREKQNVYA